MFVLDKTGKILYTNKNGAKVVKNRFDTDYSGPKKSIGNIYDLIHDTSKVGLRGLQV